MKSHVITTKFCGPTDCTGSRIVASCRLGEFTTKRLTHPYDHAHNAEWNRQEAANKLAHKLGLGFAHRVGDSGVDFVTRPSCVQLMLSVNTNHMPGATKDADDLFGDHVNTPHEFGWYVPVEGGLANDPAWMQQVVPAWLQPIYNKALLLECHLINFDVEGEIHSDLPLLCDPEHIP